MTLLIIICSMLFLPSAALCFAEASALANRKAKHEERVLELEAKLAELRAKRDALRYAQLVKEISDFSNDRSENI